MQVSADDFAENMKTVGASFPISGTVCPRANGKFDATGTIVRTENRWISEFRLPICD
jgi:hypothetical protein